MSGNSEQLGRQPSKDSLYDLKMVFNSPRSKTCLNCPSETPSNKNHQMINDEKLRTLKKTTPTSEEDKFTRRRVLRLLSFGSIAYVGLQNLL